MSRIIKIGTHSFATTHEEKVLFPRSWITKGDLLDYYQKIAPYLLPHIKNRPILMHRFENGIDHKGEFHHSIASPPEWIKIKKISNHKTKITKNFRDCLLINNPETLLYVINECCIAPYVSLHS